MSCISQYFPARLGPKAVDGAPSSRSHFRPGLGFEADVVNPGGRLAATASDRSGTGVVHEGWPVKARFGFPSFWSNHHDRRPMCPRPRRSSGASAPPAADVPCCPRLHLNAMPPHNEWRRPCA
jgi:hypothetical protein